MRVIVAAVAVAALAAAVGCRDGGDSPSLEKYFARIEEAGRRADDRSNDVERALDEAFSVRSPSGAFDDEDRTVLHEQYREFARILDDFADDLRDVDAPGELRPGHEEAVEAMDALARLYADVVDRVAEVDSVNELVDVLEPLNQAARRVGDACDELQRLADGRDIDVDLNCDG